MDKAAVPMGAEKAEVILRQAYEIKSEAVRLRDENKSEAERLRDENEQLRSQIDEGRRQLELAKSGMAASSMSTRAATT